MLKEERGMGMREGIKGERGGMGFRGEGMGMSFFFLFLNFSFDCIGRF